MTLTLGAEQVTLQVWEDQYILDAGWQAGLDLPASCLQGWCLTCAGRLLRGEVDQQDARRYYPADREAGFVLLCTARPRSPLRIATHQKEACRAHRRSLGLPTPLG
ncbi:MAG: 2Fe-2S iron-sulfur cluster-binding protein [Candidatus Latescibacterota bacterium]